MSTLLFPGRHLVNTRFQAEYLQHLLGRVPAEIPGLQPGRAMPATPLTRVVFAITSSNQEHSRYNPVAFHIRAIGVDRFARQVQTQVPFTYRIVGIPHYGHTSNFAAFTLKEIAGQSEGTEALSPADTVVVCSTPEVIQLYQALGFTVAPAELTMAAEQPPTTPIELIRAIGNSEADWAENALLRRELAEATQSLFADFPEVPRRIARIYQDPLTNQDGSLTEKRNYNTYARGMNEILRLKYLDIREAIRPGRIVDEGCADGGLLAEISADFPDSDLYGIDLSAEFAARFQERKRSGDFGNVYTCFYHRNLLDPIFEPGSVDTTICNSTLHELWSYAAQEQTVRAYLAMKFAQLRPGGRLVIRDVVGPEDGDTRVVLRTETTDGTNPDVGTVPADRSAAVLRQLSSRVRFQLFAADFLADLRRQGRRAPETAAAFEVRPEGFALSLRLAAEFLSKKDYVDNWRSEMNEEFCFWSFTRWRQVLGETGFRVLDASPQFPAGSRVYTNPWIVDHRYRGHVRLTDPTGTELPYPPTNMVLVAEKPERPL